VDPKFKTIDLICDLAEKAVTKVVDLNQLARRAKQS